MSVILGFIVVVFVLVGLVRLFNPMALSGFYYNRFGNPNSMSQVKFQAIDRFLTENFTYYNHLSPEGKSKFISRMGVILESKKFYAKDELEPTREMLWLFSAAVTQLTFGLRNYTLPNFDEVFLYPDIFYMRINRAHMKGGTSKGGRFYLSWKHLKHGYEVGDDKINLALHELAHALKMEILGKYEFNDRFKVQLERVLRSGRNEFKRMRAGYDSFLREYGKTNQHEFFAVCVEHFFEAPHEFREELPNLYFQLTRLLKQDPSNTTGDYGVESAVTRKMNEAWQHTPVTSDKAPKKGFDHLNWSLSVFALGMFVGIVITFVMRSYTMITMPDLALLWLTSAFLGGFWFRRSLYKSGFMALHWFIGFLVIGFAPLILGGALLLNFLVPIDYTEENYQVTYITDSAVQLEDDVYRDYPQARTKRDGFGHLHPRASKIRLHITFRRGILGWRVVDENHLYVTDYKAKKEPVDKKGEQKE